MSASARLLEALPPTAQAAVRARLGAPPEDPSRMSFFLASLLQTSLDAEQLLRSTSALERLESVLAHASFAEDALHPELRAAAARQGAAAVPALRVRAIDWRGSATQQLLALLALLLAIAYIGVFGQP